MKLASKSGGMCRCWLRCNSTGCGSGGLGGAGRAGIIAGAGGGDALSGAGIISCAVNGGMLAEILVEEGNELSTGTKGVSTLGGKDGFSVHTRFEG